VYARLVGILVLGLIVLPALGSTSGQAPVVRVVVGFEGEDVVGELLAIPGVSLVKMLAEIRAVVLYVPENALDAIKGRSGVRYVERDSVARALGLSSYPDVLWNVYMINATDVWDTYYSSYGWRALGYGVVVAVLDTGVDYTHPELRDDPSPPLKGGVSNAGVSGYPLLEGVTGFTPLWVTL